jgi:D-alanyl-D-alanine carboxypeptidase
MSPRDVARSSFELASQYPAVTELSSNYTYESKNIKGKKVTLKNTNPLVASIPNVIFSKTGYTDLAGGNLVMIVEPRENIWVAMVVMKSVKGKRLPDMRKLTQALFLSFDQYDEANKLVETILVEEN